MRVALDVRPLQYPGAHRGIGRYVRQLAGELARSELELYLLAENGPLPSGLESCPRLLASTSRPAVRQLGWLWDEREGERWSRFPVDVIHLTSPFDLSFGWPTRCALPRVMTIYDMFCLDYPLPGWRRLGRPMYQWLCYKLRHLQGLVCISQATRKRVKAHLGRSCPPSWVTLLGSTLGPSEGPPPEGLPGKYLLLFPCWPAHKNAASVVAALSPLGPSGPALVIAGRCPPEFEASLRSLAGGLPLSFVGELTEPQLWTLYRRSQGLIFPSLREGFGLTPLEALAAGTLAAVANREPMNEVISHPDLVFDPQSASSIREACLRLWDSPRRDEWKSWAARRVGELSWSQTAAATLEVYRRILGPNPPSD